MLDTHYHTTNKNITERVTENVTIHEHRAPTDESLRILNEYKEKGLASIIKEINIKDNTINGCILVLQHQVSSSDLCLYIRFNLNGKEFNTSMIVERIVLIQQEMINSHLLISYLYEEIAKQVSKCLLESNPEFLQNIMR